MNTEEPRRRCIATTLAGGLCNGYTLKGELYCLFHSKSERARELRRKASAGRDVVVTRREMLRALSADFRSLVGKNDDASRRERNRLASLLQQLLSEQQQLSRIRRMAKEKGLL